MEALKKNKMITALIVLDLVLAVYTVIKTNEFLRGLPTIIITGIFC